MQLPKKNIDKPDWIQHTGLRFFKTNLSLLDPRQVALFYIGFGSILSQILLVREFLVSFYGNELSIGIIYACWLMWIGIGSAFGNRITRRKQGGSHFFFILITIAPLVTFVQILLVKFVRAFVQTTTGEFLSMAELLVFSCIVLSVGCCLWGLLFTLGAKLLTLEDKELWFGVNKAYVLESLGSVVGGLLFSFVLASSFTTFQTLALNILLAWSVASYLVIPFEKNKIAVSESSFPSLPQRGKIFVTSAKKKYTPAIIFLLTIVLFIFLLNPLSLLEQKIDSHQWFFINNNLTFVRSTDTKYQNLSLLRLENQYTIYANGRPAYNIPNTYDAEVFVHSIMIHHANAKQVLLLGSGFNGTLKEILKYPVQKVEYVEIDPSLLPFVGTVLDKQNQLVLQDRKINIVSGDGREYLRQTGTSYDVILINVGEPSTASLNRFFTSEFFQQCALRLTPNGIIAFTFPSSTEYIADELKDLDASLYHTFKQVFANVLIVPGTHAILIGSKDTQPLVSQSDSLAHLYRVTGISSEYFSEYVYEDLMLPERIKSITNTLESMHNFRLNSDANPVTYYFDLLLWNRFLQGDNQFFSFITTARILVTVGVGIGLLLLLLFLRRRQPEKQEKTALAIIIAFGGMSGMALNLLFLLNFQETFGSVYEMVGAMTAANMLGLALGAFIVARLFHKVHIKTLLFGVLGVLAVMTLFLPKLLEFLLFTHAVPVTLSFTMASGGLIGMLFGIVNRLYLLRSLNVGSVYTFDVLGSSIGALTTCSVLLPVMGIQETAWLLTLVVALAVVASMRLHTQR